VSNRTRSSSGRASRPPRSASRPRNPFCCAEQHQHVGIRSAGCDRSASITTTNSPRASLMPRSTASTGPSRRGAHHAHWQLVGQLRASVPSRPANRRRRKSLHTPSAGRAMRPRSSAPRLEVAHLAEGRDDTDNLRLMERTEQCSIRDSRGTDRSGRLRRLSCRRKREWVALFTIGKPLAHAAHALSALSGATSTPAAPFAGSRTTGQTGRSGSSRTCTGSGRAYQARRLASDQLGTSNTACGCSRWNSVCSSVARSAACGQPVRGANG